jgi:hypothetical protein
MHIINAHFESLDTVPVTALFGQLGVYVLWSAKADVRASYIGEGVVLHRLATEHVARFGDRTQGYTAIMADGSEKRRKADAEIVEAALLSIGEDIDQRPLHNDKGGKTKGIRALFAAGHGVVRLNFSGYHPLRWNAPLRGTAQVSVEPVEVSGREGIRVAHTWRRVT